MHLYSFKNQQLKRLDILHQPQNDLDWFSMPIVGSNLQRQKFIHTVPHRGTKLSASTMRITANQAVKIECNAQKGKPF